MALDPYTDGSGDWAPPQINGQMRFRDVGSTGLRQFSGWVREEFLPQLLGRQAATVYREMLDNSSSVGSLIFAITQSVRKVEWRVVAANETPAARVAAEFADSLRFDMSHSWEDFVTEALSMLGYGFSLHEIVYKRRDDGLIGLRRLPIRSQDTILKWFFDENGEVRGVTQQPWVGELIDIPIEKLLLFRPTSHKNNPEGRSILRNAYRPYYFLKRLEEQEAVLFERFAGLPVLKVPSALLAAATGANATPEAVAALAAYKNLVTNVRVDDQMGVIVPSDMWQDANGNPTGQPMYQFSLETPQSGRSGVDPNVSIQRYKLDILMTVLADFVMLGHEQHGTQALSVDKTEMFLAAIEGWINSIAAVLNHHLLPRVWRINAFDTDLMPKFEPSLASRPDLDALGGYLRDLAGSGLTLFPDKPLETYLRQAAGMPI
jgi:hypothetical protein